MVSPAPLVASNPPLSWAERAKKAQHAKPQAATQRSGPQGTSSLTPGSTSSTARTSPVVSPPSVSKASSSGSTGSDSRISTLAEQTPFPPPSHNPATLQTNSSSDPKSNGDITHHGDSISAAPPTASAHRQGAAPVVNVWDLRKEKMARDATQLRPSQSTNQTAPAALRSPPPSVESSMPPPASPTTSNHAIPGPKTSQSSAHPATNGHLVPTTDFDDPFVVKPGRSPSNLNLTPPAIDDTESWPEVGQAVATPPNGKKDGREEGERGHEREPSHGHGSRKSEKTKWVPVPPEDLQFEGPARAPHARQRSQNQDRSHARHSGGASGAGSSSGQGSQQQSRTHSAAGRRGGTPSHTGSVSHSQTQSRTGSVQSSPRHTSLRGGKRLPDDINGSTLVTNRSLRSSRTNSPSTYAQPQPLPPQEFIPNSRPYVNTSVTQGGRELPALSAIPDSTAADMNLQAPFYPPPPFGVSPYHSPQPSGSPANNPYALPPLTYPGQPGLPGHIPMSGYGTPPYPMYAPPYPYPYGPQYVYWPPPGAPPPQLMATSPMANAQPSEGVPPPTMMARPPPPSESDAVAGYRDVGFVLPPPAEQPRLGQGEERGRRVPELNFGSIIAGLGNSSKSPSPAPASPGVNAVPEGAALGLDVSGGHLPVQMAAAAAAAPTPQGDVPESQSFTVFSIGVAPGEAGPARLRSRTRTLSRGPATSVSMQEIPGEQVAVEDPVDVLADGVAKVVDLTDPETKWVFGTTKTVESTDEGAIEAPPLPMTDAAPPVEPPFAGVPGQFVPAMAQYANAPPFVPPIAISGGPVNGMPSATSPSAYGPRPPVSATEEDWEVRNFGYGFGRDVPGPVYPQAAGPPAYHRDDRPRRDYQHGEREHYGRPRRGSYGQYGYERGGERGSYGGGRRARGLGGGYNGRGYSNRSYSGRGGYSGPRQPSYVPPAQPQADASGYYAPPLAPIATYIPPSYEAYPPYNPQYQQPPPPPHTPSTQGAPAPLPMPQSAVSFPLDSTRYYLLGQLEYYLSAQNLAQDFYLRQQMDSRGWIPISLFASFKRVRTLTTDTQLVTDVLTLSSLVEVRGGYVRMRQWQHFVLPTAQSSRVEDEDYPQPHEATAAVAIVHPHPHAEHHGEPQNHDGEEEEEEEVEFVL